MSHKVSRRVVARVMAGKLQNDTAHHKHWIKVLAAYLVEANRVHEVDLIVNDIARELFEQQGDLSVSVTSAYPLSEQVRHSLKLLLKDATGARHIYMDETRDENLLGGLVARTPDAQLDVSVRTTLRQLAAIK